MRCCVQVSAIGDAFLVVNDVSAMKSPGTSVEHVANTALAVMSLAKHVSCRFDYGDGSRSVKVSGQTATNPSSFQHYMYM